MSALNELYRVISERKNNPQEGSYTCYLFEKGLDKILKKIGEESAETIIAAKDGNKDELKEETCDLMYHLLVLLANEGIEYREVEEILKQRSQKIGNLKTMKQTDRNT